MTGSVIVTPKIFVSHTTSDVSFVLAIKREIEGALANGWGRLRFVGGHSFRTE